MVEATRAHNNYKIIQNSILQVIFGLQNFVETDETGTAVYEFSSRSFWLVVEIKRSSYDQITSVLRIELKSNSAPRGDRESSFNGKFIVTVNHIAHLGMT